MLACPKFWGVCYFTGATTNTHMKKLSAIIIALAIAFTAPSFAAGKGGKGKGKEGRACMKGVRGFDSDKNHQIDGKEADALKKAFAGNADLKALDTNANGTLDDDEITALNAKMVKHGKGAGKGAKKK